MLLFTHLRSFPLQILDWPECSVSGNPSEDQQLKDSIRAGFRNPVVNTVDMSSDGRYLVAVTDNNLVCIWKFSEHSSQSGPNSSPATKQKIATPVTSTGPNITTSPNLASASLSAHPLPTAAPSLSVSSG